MNFLSVDWADSDIESIFIEYNRAELAIWNDSLQKELLVECVGLAGITNLCVWDDTTIMSASINSVCNEENDFVRNLFLAYEKDYDYGGRSLNKGLLELEIQLSNYISFSIYCQKIDVIESQKDEKQRGQGDGLREP